MFGALSVALMAAPILVIAPIFQAHDGLSLSDTIALGALAVALYTLIITALIAIIVYGLQRGNAIPSSVNLPLLSEVIKLTCTFKADDGFFDTEPHREASLLLNDRLNPVVFNCRARFLAKPDSPAFLLAERAAEEPGSEEGVDVKKGALNEVDPDSGTAI